MKTYLAVDIGASSGRHILGWVENEKIFTEEIYRFENGFSPRKGKLCWNLEGLFQEIVNGMKACREKGKVPDSMGIDTWAVDFVLLDRNGGILGDSVSYRDSRTQGMDRNVEREVSPQALYGITGIQKQSFNTIYQLAAVKQEDPALLERAHRFLMVPDYLHYRLTGRMENEYTNATTTGLVNAEGKCWDSTLLEKLGYPLRLFGPLCAPGTLLGRLSPDIREAAGFDCQVRLPATHDTGSAFLAVPASGENSAFLSSGTWSLLGVENEKPITSEESRRHNFTNEGGYRYRYRYLKNIMGLWMIQSLRKELSTETHKISFGELERLARESLDFPARIDVNDQRFLSPDNMGDAIRSLCGETGQRIPETPGELMACVYHSLADSYREGVEELRKLTGRRISSLHIVGGGSRDSLLNQLTADALGLPVYAGPTEGTALGNLMVQMIENGEFSGLESARQGVRESFPIQTFLPEGKEDGNEYKV